MIAKVLIAAAFCLTMAGTPPAQAAKAVEASQEAYFHLRQSVAFLEANQAGKCKDGFKLATANIDESIRVSEQAIEKLNDKPEDKLNPLSAWQERIQKHVRDGKIEKHELATLTRELRAYGDKIKYKAPKSWDSEIAKHCSDAPF